MKEMLNDSRCSFFGDLPEQWVFLVSFVLGGEEWRKETRVRFPTSLCRRIQYMNVELNKRLRNVYGEKEEDEEQQ